MPAVRCAGAEQHGQPVGPGALHVGLAVGDAALSADLADLGDRLELAGFGEVLLALYDDGGGGSLTPPVRACVAMSERAWRVSGRGRVRR